MESNLSITLPLNNIDELFTAPDVNPFSTHEVDILGQAAMECIEKRVTRHWPRKPASLHVTLQLPANQVTPDLTDKTRLAVKRYCTKQIEANRTRRQVVIQRSTRQLLYAALASAAALTLIAILWAAPSTMIPEALRGLLIMLAGLAVGVLLFDALWSVAFDWVPFVQDNTVHTIMRDMDVAIEAQPGDQAV